MTVIRWQAGDPMGRLVGPLEIALESLEHARAALQDSADSEPDPARASVLRRAAADVSVIAERVR